MANDNSVSPEVAAAVSSALDGNHQPVAETNGPLLLTMTEAAKVLGVSRSTLWRMVKEKMLAPVEITPRVFRISRHSVQELAARHSRYQPVKRGPQT